MCGASCRWACFTFRAGACCRADRRTARRRVHGSWCRTDWLRRFAPLRRCRPDYSTLLPTVPVAVPGRWNPSCCRGSSSCEPVALPVAAARAGRLRHRERAGEGQRRCERQCCFSHELLPLLVSNSNRRQSASVPVSARYGSFTSPRASVPDEVGAAPPREPRGNRIDYCLATGRSTR